MKKVTETLHGSHSSRAANFRFVLTWLLISIATTAAAAPSSIHYQPRDQTVILYQQAAFGVIASGTAPLSYQWRKDGIPIAGATNDQVVVVQAHFSDSGLYSAVVSNAEGNVTSAEARLTVNPPKAGDVDFSFAGLSGTDNGVYSVVPQSDGKVLIGGGHITVNGVRANAIARLNADGTLDTSFQSNLLAENPIVYSVALQSDGKVLIGGRFDPVSGENRKFIARVNADGTLDSDFRGPLLGAPLFSGVNSIALLSDGKVLIGDEFGYGDGRYIARLNADGTLDSSFLNGLSEARNSFVASVAGQRDGKMLIGGSLPTINGISRNGIARLNGDGTLDTGFQNATSGISGWAKSIAVQSDGKVLVGGYFTMVDGVSRNYIARLNADGTLDTGFQTELLGMGVCSVALQSDGKVLIAGNFTTANGAASIARLWGSADIPPRIKSIVRSGADLNLMWDALPNRSYRVQYKQTLPGNTWTDLPGDVSTTSGVASKIDSTLGNVSQRYYRVLLLPQNQ